MSSPFQVSVTVCPGAQLPELQSRGAAGFDLHAFLPAPLTLAPLQRTLIPTGIAMAIPEGYEAQIRPRSGLALRAGITCLNSPGTIDSDYRGEIKVLLINCSKESYTIENKDRIAQLVFSKISPVEWKEVPSLSPTERGPRGFGHTGK